MSGPGERGGVGRSLVGRARSLAAWVAARFPHLPRAAALVGVGFALAACSNAANPLGIRWLPSPDGRAGIPRVFESRLPEASAKDALKLWRERKAVFVDARDAKDYQQDHIPGAISIPMREWHAAWPKMRHKVPRRATLLLYCYGGKCGLSTRMGKRLLELGYEKPVILEYGWKEWTEAHYPTAHPPKPKAIGRRSAATSEVGAPEAHVRGR